MAQFAGALGQPSEHRVTMRNGFVAGKLDGACEAFCGLNGLFLHGKILARGVFEAVHTLRTKACPMQAGPELQVAPISPVLRVSVSAKNRPYFFSKFAGASKRIMERGELKCSPAPSSIV